MNKSEFSVQRDPIDLAEIAREVARRYEGQAPAFDVELGLVVEGPAPAVGDADRMLQVGLELVENALRLTPRRLGQHRRRAGHDRGRGHRARPARRGAAARLRALLSLLALRGRAACRLGPRPRDREAARRGDGRDRRGVERAGRPDAVRRAPPAAGRARARARARLAPPRFTHALHPANRGLTGRPRMNASVPSRRLENEPQADRHTCLALRAGGGRRGCSARVQPHQGHARQRRAHGHRVRDRIRALAGNDTVNALGGNDRVWAGPGNDTVDGGAGRDRLRGGNGNDTSAAARTTTSSAAGTATTP